MIAFPPQCHIMAVCESAIDKEALLTERLTVCHAHCTLGKARFNPLLKGVGAGFIPGAHAFP